MAAGTDIKTYFQGTWHDGNIAVMRAADHGAWLASTVFDGARYVDGVAPDLWAHCERINRSAEALMLKPTHSTQEIFDACWEGLRLYPKDAAVYIRPMYWGLNTLASAILNTDEAEFCICLEVVPMAAPDAPQRLTTTPFRRPVMETNICNAKAGCLYPNNARIMAGARANGYDNALVADAMGNVAETGVSNIFMVKDGEVFTPIANGTFLAGITRARHMKNLRADGVTVHETVLSFDDFRDADEVFMTGNLNKVTPVSEFDGTHYQIGPVTRRARELYWDWAHSEKG
ncbi:MAG: branched-chain amino acid aminotransferase [Mangrovicoccus sp.]